MCAKLTLVSWQFGEWTCYLFSHLLDCLYLISYPENAVLMKSISEACHEIGVFLMMQSHWDNMVSTQTGKFALHLVSIALSLFFFN